MDEPATRVEVRTLAHGGAGVGAEQEAAGPAWFVEGALPGEVVEAVATHRAKRFVKARLQSVLEPSEARVQPPCPLASTCGGCSWQHVATSRQGTLKRGIVADQLRKLVDDRRVQLAFEGSPQGYRRRARLHYAWVDGVFRVGFYAARTREVVDSPKCPVLHPALGAAVQALRTVASALPSPGELLALTDGESAILGLPGVRPDALAQLEPALGAPLIGIEARAGRRQAHVGRRTLSLHDAQGCAPMRASAFVFTQAQAQGNQALVQHVARMANADGRRVLELYAGAGNFTRALARHATRVWASDSDRESIDLLRETAKRNALPINAKRQSAERLLPRLAQSKTQYDVVVLDPPRAGVGAIAAAAACHVAQERIVYVSCDPATLARDLQVARENGFDIADVSVFDLMPMTPEVEVVATLRRVR